jgi:hypothetical protein
VTPKRERSMRHEQQVLTQAHAYLKGGFLLLGGTQTLNQTLMHAHEGRFT